MFKFFDALILPVVTYDIMKLLSYLVILGNSWYDHQIWLPLTDAFKEILLATSTPERNGQTSTLKKIANDPIERLPQYVLKWTLGLPEQMQVSYCRLH
jgi:hypothetical protein